MLDVEEPNYPTKTYHTHELEVLHLTIQPLVQDDLEAPREACMRVTSTDIPRVIHWATTVDRGIQGRATTT